MKPMGNLRFRSVAAEIGDKVAMAGFYSFHLATLSRGFYCRLYTAH